MAQSLTQAELDQAELISLAFGPDAGPWEREISTLGDELHVEKRPQPRGEAGVMHSLEQVAKMAVEGMHNPQVQAWSVKQLRSGGNPTTPRGRAKVLLEAIRRDKIWVPDPVGTERLVGAHLMLGDGEHAPMFEGGDCDDLTLALVGAFLACNASVGTEAAVVGHSYLGSRQIGHVLGAVIDEGRWYYVEPSSTAYAFGESKTPTREVVILVPSMRKACDADVCLTGQNALQPGDIMDGHFMAVRGLEDGSGQLGDPSSPDWSKVTISQTAQDTADQWALFLHAQADDMEHIGKRLRSYYDGMQTTLAELGLPAITGTGDNDWTAKTHQTLVDLLSALEFVIGAMRDAATGKRHLIMTDVPDWAIEALPGDPFHIEAQGSSILLVKNPPSASQQSHGIGLELGPLAIGGIIVALLAASGLQILLIKTLLGGLENVMSRVLQYKTNAAYVDCVTSGKCTPEQAANLAKAIGDQAATINNSEASRIAVENAPIMQAFSFGTLLLGAATGALLGAGIMHVTMGAGSSSSAPRRAPRAAASARTERAPRTYRSPRTMVSG